MSFKRCSANKMIDEVDEEIDEDELNRLAFDAEIESRIAREREREHRYNE